MVLLADYNFGLLFIKFESEGNTMNISNTLKALILCIFGTPLFASGNSNGHPILTPLEP